MKEKKISKYIDKYVTVLDFFSMCLAFHSVTCGSEQ